MLYHMEKLFDGIKRIFVKHSTTKTNSETIYLVNNTKCVGVGLKMTSVLDQWKPACDWALLSLVAHVTGLCKYCSLEIQIWKQVCDCGCEWGESTKPQPPGLKSSHITLRRGLLLKHWSIFHTFSMKSI